MVLTFPKIICPNVNIIARQEFELAFLYIYIYIYICIYQSVNIFIGCILTNPRPGCQNSKCTCVNNWCIRSRNIRIITLTVDRLNECEIVTPTRRRWTLNYYITQLQLEIRWGSDELEIRCGRENQNPERLGLQAFG